MAAPLPFPPRSRSWEVLRQPVFLVGGGRALLLQLAAPAVAAGVAAYSDFERHPFRRLRRTMELMTAVGLGDETARRQALATMEHTHARVRGRLPDGSRYTALDQPLRLWVLATLIDTVLEVEARYLGEWTESERSTYYGECLTVIDAFAVPGELVPPDLAAFRRYFSTEVEALEVTEEARRLAASVLHPRSPLPDTVWSPLRLATASLLPPSIRAAYGLPWDEHRLRRAGRLERSVGGTFTRLPWPIRTFPLLHPLAGR